MKLINQNRVFGLSYFIPLNPLKGTFLKFIYWLPLGNGVKQKMNLRKLINLMVYPQNSIYTLFIVLLASCSQGNTEHESNIEKIMKFTEEVHYEMDSRDQIGEVDLQLVVPQIEEVADFYIEKQSAKIESFPCSNCHTKDLETLQAEGTGELQKAHWNIQIEHAGAETMDCLTCHSESDLNKLNSITGTKIDIDESYKSCAQCHSTQYKEWQGGAHGKRVGGWVPPRIIKTCVECHNPHKPAFESRWPSRLNTAKLTD
jgi:hypothetical protein